MQQVTGPVCFFQAILTVGTYASAVVAPCGVTLRNDCAPPGHFDPARWHHTVRFRFNIAWKKWTGPSNSHRSPNVSGGYPGGRQFPLQWARTRSQEPLRPNRVPTQCIVAKLSFLWRQQRTLDVLFGQRGSNLRKQRPHCKENRRPASYSGPMRPPDRVKSTEYPKVPDKWHIPFFIISWVSFCRRSGVRPGKVS